MTADFLFKERRTVLRYQGRVGRGIEQRIKNYEIQPKTPERSGTKIKQLH